MAKAQAQEPSMEEILASIRRIIADEDAAQASPRGAAAAKPASGPPPVAAAPAPAAAPMPPARPQPVEPSLDEDDLDRMFARADNEEDEVDLIELSEADIAAAEDAALEPVPPQEDDISFDPLPQPAAPPPRPEPPPEPPMTARAAPPRQEEPHEEEPRPHAVLPPPPVMPAHVNGHPSEQLLSADADAAVAHAFNTLAGTILSQNARTLEDLVGEMLRPMLKDWLDTNLPSLVERLVKAEIERVSRGNRRF